MGVSFRQACYALASVCIVGTGLLVATVCAAAVPRDNLQGEWLLDSNTINGSWVVSDTSGSGYNGTQWVASAATRALTTDRIGNPNGTVYLTGTGGTYVSMIYGPYFNDAWSFTISAWFKAEDNTSTFFVLKNANYGFQWRGTGQSILFYNGTSHYSTKTNWELNKWYHVVMTDNGSNAVKLYVNGILDKNETRTFPNRWTSGYSLYFWAYPTSQWFKGSVDDVRAYSGVLSDAQIGSLYTEEPAPTNATQYATLYSNTNQVLTNSGKTYDATDASSYTATSNAKQIAVAATKEKNTNNAADPITLPKGEFTYENTLMRLPGKNLPFEFTLNYKNQAYYNGPTGINWDHNYDLSLNTEANGNVLYSNGKLGVYRFIKSGSTFGYNAGLRANLTQSGSTYTITYDSGDKYTFSGSTRITKIEDRNGNSLAFAYSWGLLSQVTDTLGRNITYTYYSHNRLKDVTEPGGRKVTLNYFMGATSTGSLYDLQSVTINNSTGATKTIRFEYSTGGTNGTNHNITRLYDALGQTYVTNTYDTGSRVTSQTYGSGTLTYAYTLSGSAITETTVTDKLGHKTEYTYDANGNQTEAKYYNEAQTGSVVYTYTYSTGGYLTKETKPRGNGWTYTYDGSGNVLTKRMKADVTASDSANDLLTTYTYNARGQVLTQTNPIGLQVINTYDGSGNLTTKTASGITSYSGAISSATGTYTYLSGGLVSTATDAEGRLTTFEYSSGQVSKIIRGTGANTASGTFAYDVYGNVTAATDGDGWTKTMDYTAFSQIGTGTTAEGNVTTYTYDANGNKTSESRVLAGGIVAHSYFYYDILDHLTGSLVDTGSGGTLATAYTYNANGNVASKKIGSGALTQYAYNEFGKVKEERVILDAWDATKDRVTTYVYDTNGNLTQKTDPMGNVYTYTYDLYDQLTQTTDPSGSYATLSYNKDGTVANQALYSSGNLIQAKTAYAYDGQGNVTQTTKYKNPSASTDPVTTKTAYDRSGKAIQTIDERGKTTSNTYDTLGRLATTTDALGNVVTYAYNKRDLVSAKTLTPASGTGTIATSYAYNHDGRPTTETDNATHTKTTAYNALGYVTSQTDENGKTTDYQTNLLGKVLLKTQYLTGSTVTTQYAYDERGNLTAVTDGENHTTNYTYNGADEVVQITYPDSSTLNYTYDKNGRVTSQTDPNGTSVSNTYDASNRLSARAITAGSGVVGVISESYAYDALWHLTYANDSQSHALGFVYDALGRLNSETNSGQTVAYSYDNSNNLTSVTHPNAKVQTYNYDDLGRPTSVSYDANSVANYVYNGIVNPSVTYGNGVTTGKSFDGLARAATRDNGVKNYSYTYDNVGNILDDAHKTYTYDNIYRLIDTQSGAINENWTYDKAGNRTTDASNSYTGNTLNQYLSVSGSLNKTYSYDANGNVLSDGEKDFRYDYKNRLVDVYESGSLVAHYEYDVLGRRVLKTTTLGSIRFTYSGENAIEEANITGSWVLKKSYLNGLGTDNVLAYDIDEEVLDGSGIVINTVTNRYYLQKDHLGSVIALTNSGWTIVAQYEYDSFGKAYVSGNSHGNTRLFTWREFDEETGLYYLKARYYSAEIGRFISRDPIGQTDDINLYIYARNNPLRFTDPRGLYIKQMYADSKNGWADYYDYIQQQKQSENFTDYASAYVADFTVAPIYNLLGNGDKMSTGEVAINTAMVLPIGKAGKAADAGIKAAEKIASGHALAKHLDEFSEFGIKNAEDLGKHVKSVIEKAKGTDNMKTLEKGRSAYWDDATKTVVIFDPNHVDKGTVMIPTPGKAYFDRLK